MISMEGSNPDNSENRKHNGDYIHTYDANGNKLTVTDSTGTITRTYDELNRTITKDVSNIGRAHTHMI
jgi:YD repeat-containing protein